jgi:hypothetical protein
MIAGSQLSGKKKKRKGKGHVAWLPDFPRVWSRPRARVWLAGRLAWPADRFSFFFPFSVFFYQITELATVIKLT